MTAAKRQSGFSLLEMIVALSILSVVMLASMEALRFAGATTSRAEAVRAETSELLVTRRVLSQWINAAYVEPLTATGASFEGEAARLSFRTIEPSFPTGRGVYDVVLGISLDEDQLYRLRATRVQSGLSYTSVLWESDAPIEWRYSERGVWRRDWPSSFGRAPDAVALTVDGARLMSFRPAAKIAGACLSRSASGARIEIAEACG